MGWYADRHGGNQSLPQEESSITPSRSGRSFYRERHLKEVPKTEIVMRDAVKPVEQTINPLERGMRMGSAAGRSLVGETPGYSNLFGKKFLPMANPSRSLTPGLNMIDAAEAAKGALTEEFSGGNIFGKIALDAISDPLGVRMAGAGLKRLPGVARKTAGWIAEPFQRTGLIRAKKAIDEGAIKSAASQSISEAERLGGMRKAVSKKLYETEPMANLEREKSYLNKKIETGSHQEAIQAQKDLRKLSGQKSSEFGTKLGELVGKEPKPVPASQVQPGLEDALLKHGVLKYDEFGKVIPARAPINSSESNLLNFWKNNRTSISENPDVVIDASDLIKTQQAIRTPFEKTKTGTDVLKDTVRENISDVVEPITPGVKELRASHAPWMRIKKQGIKELRPWNTEYDTGTAAKFIARKSTGKLHPDEKSLLGHLEKELGKEVNPITKKFGNRLSQSAEREAKIKSRALSEKAKIDSVVEQAKELARQKEITSIQELEKEVSELLRKNNLDIWKRSLLTSSPITGPIVGYVLRNVIGFFKKNR